MSDQNIQIEKDGHVLVIRFTNDEMRNSLSPAMRDGLANAIHQAANDYTVRALYITGSGRSFCAGGDFETLSKFNDSYSTHNRFRHMSGFLTQMIRMPKPIVMGVNGYAVGGGVGLALAGDVIFAAESAKFMAGFMRLGAIPDYGTMYSLPRLVGMARAKNFLFSNGTWTAADALEMGIVAKVLPDDELYGAALAHAHALADGPIEAMGITKMIMGRSFEQSAENMLAFESLGQPLAFRTEAFQEGFGAVKSKAEADFPSASDREYWHKHLVEED